MQVVFIMELISYNVAFTDSDGAINLPRSLEISLLCPEFVVTAFSHPTCLSNSPETPRLWLSKASPADREETSVLQPAKQLLLTEP